MIASKVKRIDFKERFKGKTSLMSKEGHIGIVKEASKPIEGKGFEDQPRSFRMNPRNKRAISQDYSFGNDLEDSMSHNGSVHNTEVKRRKFNKNSHHSLSDVGSSIMKQSNYLRDSMQREELNKSLQPEQQYYNPKSKVCVILCTSFCILDRTKIVVRK